MARSPFDVSKAILVRAQNLGNVFAELGHVARSGTWARGGTHKEASGCGLLSMWVLFLAMSDLLDMWTTLSGVEQYPRREDDSDAHHNDVVLWELTSLKPAYDLITPSTRTRSRFSLVLFKAIRATRFACSIACARSRGSRHAKACRSQSRRQYQLCCGLSLLDRVDKDPP